MKPNANRWWWTLCVFCAVTWGLLHAGARVQAVSTRLFSLDSADVLSEGELEGAAVESSGVVVPGVGTRRFELPNVGVARSLLVGRDGTAYVGTGNDGTIWKLVGSQVSEFARTEQLLVSALAKGDGDVLYAGTLPEGKIFAVDKKGKVTLFAQPEGAEHIWALVYDPEGKTLYAATGPEGKVWAIDRRGESEVYYESAAPHVMALVRDDDGTLYAGTSEDALVLKLLAPGRAEVVYDFEGSEVTAIAVSKGRLAVAANLFKKKKSRKGKRSSSSTSGRNSKRSSKSAAGKAKPGKGDLWRIGADGRARKLFTSSKGHITALQWADDGVIYAATGKEGHVYRVQPDGSHSLWIDVDERQVLAIDFVARAPLLATGDAGAVYRVLPGKASKARWTSKVLDADFHSRFGQLTWRGQGKLGFQTRSGNTEKPDDSWSEWSSVLTQPGPIRSPAARFLQIRLDLDPSVDSVMYAVQAYYLPRNQPVTLSDISAEPKHKKGKKGKDEPTTVYKLDWKVDNPDDDELRYRLYYRPEGRGPWRAILKESEVLTESDYEWETEAIPDGFYRIRVEASDELANPEYAALVGEGLSEPFRVDNHRPHIERLRYANDKVFGIARDTLGPIASLEYAVDGHEWHPFYPADDLFDTAREPFELELPSLSKGVHVVAVRARDAGNNATTDELEIRVR